MVDRQSGKLAGKITQIQFFLARVIGYQTLKEGINIGLILIMLSESKHQVNMLVLMRKAGAVAQCLTLMGPNICQNKSACTPCYSNSSGQKRVVMFKNPGVFGTMLLRATELCSRTSSLV